MERVDAHFHTWHFRAEEFGWIPDRAAALRRNFLLPDLQEVMREAGVGGAVAVQARRSVEETRFLLALDPGREVVRGVVGWASLVDDQLDRMLAEFAGERRLVGLREVIEAEPAGYLDQPAVDCGVRLVTERGSVFDLLVRADQMEEALRFVSRHPRQRFVLDHAAKPRIAEGLLEPWRRWLGELARHENVFCKLSGMVTEARWDAWDLGTLQPYLDAIVEAFGAGRLMVGSDWPVCTLATSYAGWWQVVEQYIAPWSETERAAVLGGNAVRWYGLAG